MIAVDPKTLRKHCRQELNTGAIKANSRIAESLYKKALGDGSQSVTAAIFWLKTRARCGSAMRSDPVGRKAHMPDAFLRRQVEAVAACGVPEADIARVIGIDPKTLRKHYRDELDTGAIKANGKIAESLYRKALGDGSQSITAAIFWLKTHARGRSASLRRSSG